jgi:hypothetical protein
VSSIYVEDVSLVSTSFAIKKKFLLDLDYKYLITKYTSKESLTGLITVDLEGKILGYKPIFNKKRQVTFSLLKVHLNKIFLNSTLFGSIKLIRV